MSETANTEFYAKNMFRHRLILTIQITVLFVTSRVFSPGIVVDKAKAGFCHPRHVLMLPFIILISVSSVKKISFRKRNKYYKTNQNKHCWKLSI